MMPLRQQRPLCFLIALALAGTGRAAQPVELGVVVNPFNGAIAAMFRYPRTQALGLAHIHTTTTRTR